MSRNKTQFRHVDSSSNVVRVTEEDGNYFIGQTDERAEGKMCHYTQVNRSETRPDYALNNPHYGSGNGEWNDYAHTADDL